MRCCRAARSSARTRSRPRPGDETVIDVDATLFPRARDRGATASRRSSRCSCSTLRTRAASTTSATPCTTPTGLQIVNGSRRAYLAAARESARAAGFRVRRSATRAASDWCSASATFDDYEDYEARYELRPSLWVEPRGDWGDGHVELVEIPTDREIHDNIVAYWQPARAARGRRPRRVLVSTALARTSRSTTRSRASSRPAPAAR